MVDGGVTGEDVDVVAVVPLWVGTVGEAAGTAADGEVAGVGVDVTGFGLAAGDDVGCGAADVAVARSVLEEHWSEPKAGLRPPRASSWYRVPGEAWWCSARS